MLNQSVCNEQNIIYITNEFHDKHEIIYTIKFGGINVPIKKLCNNNLETLRDCLLWVINELNKNMIPIKKKHQWFKKLEFLNVVNKYKQRKKIKSEINNILKGE
jgi:hypothetical protein